jgi:hypothetical protein
LYTASTTKNELKIKMDKNKVFSIFNFKSDKNESLSENNEPQEALENNSVAEVDPDDPPVLPDVQKLFSESIDIGDINTGPIRPKLQVCFHKLIYKYYVVITDFTESYILFLRKIKVVTCH